jgi:hypothetical protein
MHLNARPSVATLAVAIALLLPAANSASAQGVHPALLVGAGRSSWSGPYAKGSKLDLNFGAALDWDALSRLTMRAELGFASRNADMGSIAGAFNEEGTLLFTQRYAGLLGRFALTSRAKSWHSYVEGGVAAYQGGTCDVDLAGGPGFLGGVTYDCPDWVPDGSPGGSAPISGVSSGVRPIFGIGATRRRLGATLRVEPMGTMAKTSTGNISATTVTLNVELTFGRRK